MPSATAHLEPGTYNHVWDEQLPALPTASVPAIPDVWQRWSCWPVQPEPETWTPGVKDTFYSQISFYLKIPI